MKTIGIASLTALATAALAWGATAFAGDQPTASARIAALEAQVTSLNERLATTARPSSGAAVTPKQFKKLQADVKKLRTDADALMLVVGGCLAYDNAGVAAYGNETEGYLYARGDQVGTTTALDWVPASQQPQGYFLAINPQCAGLVHPEQTLTSLAGALRGKLDGSVAALRTAPLTKRVP